MIFPRFTRPCIPGHCVLQPIIIYDLLSMNGRRGELASSAISCDIIIVSEAEVLKEMRRAYEKGDGNIKWDWGLGMKCKLWNEKKRFYNRQKEISYSNCILAVRIKL